MKRLSVVFECTNCHLVYGARPSLTEGKDVENPPEWVKKEGGENLLKARPSHARCDCGCSWFRAKRLY